MIVTAEVIRPVRIPAGELLDGRTVTEPTWVMDGRHDIDADLIDRMEWASRGFVAPEMAGDKPIIWAACCQCG